jgi:hypothetical protein
MRGETAAHFRSVIGSAPRACQGGFAPPVDPPTKRGLPSLDHPWRNSPVPAPQGKGSVPFAIRAQEPSSPDPARKGDRSPFLHHPREP